MGTRYNRLIEAVLMRRFSRVPTINVYSKNMRTKQQQKIELKIAIFTTIKVRFTWLFSVLNVSTLLQAILDAKLLLR